MAATPSDLLVDLITFTFTFFHKSQFFIRLGNRNNQRSGREVVNYSHFPLISVVKKELILNSFDSLLTGWLAADSGKEQAL